jgi:hypothetical protein
MNIHPAGLKLLHVYVRNLPVIKANGVIRDQDAIMHAQTIMRCQHSPT